MCSDDRPVKTDRFKVKDLVDELLLYDSEGQKIHVLNATVREIYLNCDGRRSVDELVRKLMEEFTVDADTAKRDTIAVLQKLIDLQIVCLGGGAAASPHAGVAE